MAIAVGGALLPVGLILNLVATTAKPGGRPLSGYIHHYEEVHYDQDLFYAAHHRAKRSTDRLLSLDFHAHQKAFRVRLRRDVGIFHSDIVIENSNGPVFYDTHSTYTGYLEDEPETSSVHGVVTTAGIFEGKITTKDDQYVIESCRRHFTEPQLFHSVIYRHSDVHMDNITSSLCKSEELHRKLKQYQKEESKQNQELHLRQQHNDTKQFGSTNYKSSTNWKEKYLHTRHKRSIDPTKTTCTLYLQADHLFYQKFHSNEETVIEQLTQHVQGVNEIYKVIDFDEDYRSDKINFIIKRIKVHTTPISPGYKFPGNYGVETFLELFSEDNFDAFCLAYMFTYRDFEGGTLGLAWTGDLQNAGGVCEKNGQFRGSLKSLNSGIVTILNYGKDVPSTVSHVTMAHEIGHNMGSQHDPETVECSPGGEVGNYIMFARATSGDKPNNNRFSLCSKMSMALVMEAKARHTSGCFIAPTSSICGNEVVEPGEDCDCGWEDECRDKCCHPQTSNDNTLRAKPCSRRHRAKCSPSEGPCCDRNCNLIPLRDNKTCRESSSCKSAAYCDGSGAQCPISRQKPDKTRCDDDYVCYQGECTGSICMAYELESCQCSPDRKDDYRDPNLCKLCCKLPGIGHTCRSSFEWNIAPYDMPDLMAKPGMPCNNYKGYCDVFRRCREVDPAGPLANLKKLIFSGEGAESVRDWLQSYWYIVLAGGVGFVIFMAIFVKVCSPKKNKTPVMKQAPSANDVAGSSLPVQPVVQHIVHHTATNTVVNSMQGMQQWASKPYYMPPTATGTLPLIKGEKYYSALSHSDCHSSNPAMLHKVPFSRTNFPATKRFKSPDGWV